MTAAGGATATETLVGQRLVDLERICRGLSHDANNLLYSVLGQTEMAEQHLRRTMAALRYIDRQVARIERAGGEAAAALPTESIAKLRKQLARKTMRKRLDGLRKARQNAEHLSSILHMLHMFAAARATTTAMVDLNAAVRAAVELLRLGYYRTLTEPPQVVVKLAEGLPAVAGSTGLLMGILIDLAAGGVVAHLDVATRREGEAIITQLDVTYAEGGDKPSEEDAFAAALAAARLCGGTVGAKRAPGRHTYALLLPTAATVQSLRSGSA